MGRGVNKRLRGSTLAEMLVMMIVAGIVFLSVMDGLRLFTRLQLRRAEAIMEAGRAVDGYYRAQMLMSDADSVTGYAGNLSLWRGGAAARLELRDSALIYATGDFRDTLLTGVGVLELDTFGDADTVTIHICREQKSYILRIGVQMPFTESYAFGLQRIENGYGE